jgi:hypothetical protein
MVSFAKVPGAGSSAPVQANAEVVDEDKNVGSTPASTAIAQRPAYVSTFSTGTEDDEPVDEGSKVRYPYLNLVQPTSKDIKAVAPEGNFVLAKTVKIPSGTRIVVVGFGKTFYREKVKWGEEGKTLYSLEEVAKAGGTTEWRQSLENARKNGGSNKPWFASCIKALLLVEKPEGADEAFFPHVVGDKCYAACLYEAKSTAYDSFYVELNSKRRTTNLFKTGWAGRFVSLTSVKGKGDDASYKPVPVVLEAAPAEFVDIAKSIASGN